MVQVLVGGQCLEVLSDLGRMAGQIGANLLDHRSRALTAAIGQGVGDKGALAAFPFRRRFDPLEAQQISDVGNHPLLAGLDEPVVVELGHVRFKGLVLLFENRHQAP